jgi:hypothetical protein
LARRKFFFEKVFFDRIRSAPTEAKQRNKPIVGLGISITEPCRKAGLGDDDDDSFMHDGTAVSVPYTGLSGHTAVIVLGSAIGGGFLPAAPKVGLTLDGFM